MKKRNSNSVTLLLFACIAVSVIIFMFLRKTPVRKAETPPPGSPETVGSAMPEPTGTPDQPESTPEAEPTAGPTPPAEAGTVNMDDALFIGDSRTVGLSEYAGIAGADFFSNVGMSVYNIHDDVVSVPTVGKVSLIELLTSKKYGKIYVMLGINELGYDFDNTVAKYSELMEFIQEKQPNATLFIEGNLHVTQSRSDSDEVINNAKINRFNAAIAKLADGEKIYYLDVNSVFDDANGNLSSEKSDDSAHPYAKYYAEWGQWIVSQTASLMKEA